MLLGGDFNQFEINKCYVDHPDVILCPSEATRGTARLDLIASNIQENFVDSYTGTPLENDDKETKSDHKTLTCVYRVPSIHTFKIIKYKTRRYTKKATKKFIEELNDTDWHDLYTVSYTHLTLPTTPYV